VNRVKNLKSIKGENKMEITKGILTKVTTTKDQCVRVTIDIDKAYAETVNLLKWQDQEVALQCEVDNG